MKNQRGLNALKSDENLLMIFAALIPDRISMDMLIEATAFSASRILGVLEALTQKGVLGRHPSRTLGLYRFVKSETADGFLEAADQKDVVESAKWMMALIEAQDEECTAKDLTLARLYYYADIEFFPVERVLRATDELKRENHVDAAATYFKMILDKTPGRMESKADKRMFVQAALGLVDLHGYRIPLTVQDVYLRQARRFCKEIDDAGMVARINLVYARTLSRTGTRGDQIHGLIEESFRLAAQTGDPHITRKTEIAKCVQLHWEGHIAEALDRWDKAVGHLEELSFDEDDLRHYAALGWGYGICGQTARGIGLCDVVLKKALSIKHEALQCYVLMMAGMTLFEARRVTEGAHYFKQAMAFPEATQGDFVLSHAHLALAFADYQARRFEAALVHIEKGFFYLKRLAWPHHRAPWAIECIEGLERRGMAMGEIHFDTEIDRIVAWPDLYMQGVAHRWRAHKNMQCKADQKMILLDFTQSLQCLRLSGAQFELAQTHAGMARFYLGQGNDQKAVASAQFSRKIFHAVNEGLFPKDLEHLIVKENPEQMLLGTMINVGNSIGTIRNRTVLLERIITLAMRLTLAERGGVFLLVDDHMELAASRNLEPGIMEQPQFAKSVQIIKKVAAANCGELIEKPQPGSTALLEALGLSWIICSPIALHSRVLGVFYLDSAHRPRGLQEKGLDLIEAIGVQVAIALDNAEAYEEIAFLRDRLENESRFFQSEVEQSHNFSRIIGQSRAIEMIQAQMQKVGPSDTAVLIEGETGVGKELVARGIHRMSKRADGPFIPLNTAVLSEGIVASELFGHEKGAFTGALQRHPGRFELADGGTIFLDDIQNLSMDIQAKLLRAVQEKKFERVGGTTTKASDFRIIAASNQPLKTLVERGQFRSDLYYRLNVFPILIPPLRERTDDIAPLVHHFVERFNRKLGKRITRVSSRDMGRLLKYPFPGNVRELEHIIERAAILSDGKSLVLPEIKKDMVFNPQTEKRLSLEEYTRLYLLDTLETCKWRVSGPHGAAKVLKVKPTTLFAKMKRLGISRK